MNTPHNVVLLAVIISSKPAKTATMAIKTTRMSALQAAGRIAAVTGSYGKIASLEKRVMNHVMMATAKFLMVVITTVIAVVMAILVLVKSAMMGTTLPMTGVHRVQWILVEMSASMRVSDANWAMKIAPAACFSEFVGSYTYSYSPSPDFTGIKIENVYPMARVWMCRMGEAIWVGGNG